MSSLLCPYLSFQGTAKQALEFYAQVFGGEASIMTFGEYGMIDDGMADLVMHGQIETPAGLTLMVSDTPPGMDHHPGTNITVCLSGTDTDDLTAWFTALCVGGTVTQPLEKQMWGDLYGACIDRFGIPWMANIAVPEG